ncbi:MAG TPA: hypothetical protein DGT23_28545 [Micromonosporaceae bacterium]|nr:hypothetical protein [Micromonosporaceae bacterium]
MRHVALGAVLAIALAACSPSAAAEPQARPTLTPVAPSLTEPSPTPSPTPTPEAKQACEAIGKFQQEVEEALATMADFGPVTVDGEQSDADCAAIKNFQDRFGLRPVDGIAGAATNSVAQRLLASDPSRCDAGRGLTACVDLTNQTTWLMRNGKVVHGPTVTRTGMKDFATPTGYYEVDWRSLKDWSKPYKVWLPYWQSFNGDIGFHETTSYLHHVWLGSHGCVNLLPADAREYWDQMVEGTSVVVFGHRAGT